MKFPAVLLQALLPQRLLGRAVYRLARCTRSWVRRPLIRWFARRYRVDLREAEHAEPDSYASLNDFFTRRLKPGVRPIAGDERTLVSPVDGSLVRFGSVDAGEMIQAKGLRYRLAELVGEPPHRTAVLATGSYATFYLAPHQYHRVHLPLAGVLRRTRYIPGRRYSVNGRTAAVLPALFCRNERVTCWFDTAAGPMVVVLVGALNVSSIGIAWLGDIPSGRPRVWAGTGPANEASGSGCDRGRDARRGAGHGLEPGVESAFGRAAGPDAAQAAGRDAGLGAAPNHAFNPAPGFGSAFARGEEIGRFNLGSTVVLVLPPERLSWRPELTSGQSVRMGQALASIT